MRLAHRIERMWWQSSTPPAWLRAASRAYRAVSRRHLARRAARAAVPPLPLISVGNITAGGSGKTPFTLWLCAELKQRGFRPVILCRGDGGRLIAPRLVRRNDSATDIGDEALMMARASVAPVIAGRDRLAGAALAVEHGDVIVLDDGFQYRQLARNCDIVLVPVEGVGNGCLLPAGPLREPVDALTRADIVVRTGTAEPGPLTTGREWRWQPVVAPPRQIAGPSSPAPKAVLAVCGIARPERFLDTLVAFGIEVRGEARFPDHHRYTVHDAARMAAHGLPVMTTDKDAVKLAPLWPGHAPLWTLPLSGQGEEGLPEAIIQTMLARRKQEA